MFNEGISDDKKEARRRERGPASGEKIKKSWGCLRHRGRRRGAPAFNIRTPRVGDTAARWLLVHGYSNIVGISLAGSGRPPCLVLLEGFSPALSSGSRQPFPGVWTSARRAGTRISALPRAFRCGCGCGCDGPAPRILRAIVDFASSPGRRGLQQRRPCCSEGKSNRWSE